MRLDKRVEWHRADGAGYGFQGCGLPLLAEPGFTDAHIRQLLAASEVLAARAST